MGLAEEADQSLFFSLHARACMYVFFFPVHLNDVCLGETGISPSASPADCRRVDQAVQPASREAALSELSPGLEAHRLVFLPHSFSLFSALSAMHQS